MKTGEQGQGRREGGDNGGERGEERVGREGYETRQGVWGIPSQIEGRNGKGEENERRSINHIRVDDCDERVSE